jgi:hypothetical protein
MIRRLSVALAFLALAACTHIRNEGDVECRGASHTWGNSGTTTAKSTCHTVTAEEAQASRN